MWCTRPCRLQIVLPHNLRIHIALISLHSHSSWLITSSKEVVASPLLHIHLVNHVERVANLGRISSHLKNSCLLKPVSPSSKLCFETPRSRSCLKLVQLHRSVVSVVSCSLMQTALSWVVKVHVASLRSAPEQTWFNQISILLTHVVSSSASPYPSLIQPFKLIAWATFESASCSHVSLRVVWERSTARAQEIALDTDQPEPSLSDLPIPRINYWIVVATKIWILLYRIAQWPMNIIHLVSISIASKMMILVDQAVTFLCYGSVTEIVGLHIGGFRGWMQNWLLILIDESISLGRVQRMSPLVVPSVQTSQ